MKAAAYLLSLFLLMACRTPAKLEEKISETAQRHETDRTAYQDELRQSLERTVKESVEEWKKSFMELNMEYSRTNYSPPDSAGKQYPMQVETGKVNKKTEEDAQSNRQREGQEKAVLSYMSQLVRRIDTVEERYVQAEREYKEKLTWYQSALIFLGGVFLVYILVTVYIRLKKP